MTKRIAVFWAIVALSIGTLTFVACGGDKNLPTGDSGIPTSSAPAPVASNPQPVTPPATGTPGILVERISSTFDPDRCTDLSQPQHKNKTELVEVAKVTNNTTRDVYAKPAIYHADKATCGALDTNPGGILGLMEAENITPGTSKNWTHRFTIPDRACGAYQFDNDAFNGEIRQSTLSNGDGGKVINTGIDCPSCEAFDVVLSVTGEGLTRTVSVTFKGQKASVKAKVDFGDNTSAQVANGGSVSHTWAYGEFVVTATLDADGISCFKSTTVSNKEQCVEKWIEQEPVITYGEYGECKKPSEASASTVTPECSQQRDVLTVISEKNSCTGVVREKSRVKSTESKPCDCKYSCEDVRKSFQETPCVQPSASDAAPTVKKCFSGSFSAGTAKVDYGDASIESIPGSPFNSFHNYAQTGAEQSFTATLNVDYKGQICPTSVIVKIPPQKDSCDNYTKPKFGGALALTSQTATQVTVTSGTVTPAGGSFNPTLPSVQTRPAPGAGDKDFNVDYTVSYGPSELKCTAEKQYDIKIPAQDEEKECKLVLVKDVDLSSAKPGDYLKYSLTVSNEGNGDCTGGGVVIKDDVPANVTYSNSSGTVGQCIWQGPIEWNCGKVKPGASITVSWKGKVENPKNNCNDFVIKNKASGWSVEKGTIWSNEVSTSVDVTCEPTCPPSSTTMSVNWTKLIESTYGNNPKCGDFGLTMLHKQEFGKGVETWSTDRAASIVIVKDGKCDKEGPDYYAKKASPQDSSKWIGSGLNVSFSCDGKGKDLSHVEMCGCPVGGASATSGGLFDPYLVNDPIYE